MVDNSLKTIKLDIQSTSVLKGVAILAVVVLHILTSVPHLYATGNPLAVFGSDQLLRFCVPLFVALSGYGFARKYTGELDLGAFIKKRVLRILPLYLLWSAIFAYWSGKLFTSEFIREILLGKADYHLYFVPMIVQLYLLFPLLLALIKRAPRLMLIASLGVQLAAFTLLVDPVRAIDQNHYGLAIFWIFYFVFGMWLGRVKKIPKGWIALVVIGFVIALATAVLSVRMGTDTLLALRFTRWPVVIYATGIIGLFLSRRFSILKLSNLLGGMLERLGNQSYLIYLSHTVLLRVGAALLIDRSPLSSQILPLIVFVVGILLSLRLQ